MDFWTPQGYYDDATGADELIGWHVNHGYDGAPDFYPSPSSANASSGPT